jgi:hypothetical protein
MPLTVLKGQNKMTTQKQLRGAKTQTAQAAEQVAGPEIVTDENGEAVQPNDKRVWTYGAMKAKIAGISMPANLKPIVGFLANLVTVGSTYYLGMMVVGTLATIVLSSTGSMFLAWLVAFIGIVITLMFALWSGAKVQSWIMNDSYRSVLEAPGKLTSWLSRAKQAVNDTAPVGA